MPSLPETQAIHEELLILLKKFDGICRENGISYSLHGGTLLGAVREKGFIPWDDDADITFTREEYEKFLAVMRKGDLESEFTFREFAAQHPRLWMRREGKTGVWLDFFIYDYISENRFVQKLRLLGCCFMLAFTKTKQSMDITIKRGRHRGVRLLLLKLGYNLGRPFSAPFKAKVMNFYCKHAFSGGRRLIHRANDQYWAMKQIFPAEIMAEYCDLPFEDAALMVTARNHDVLRAAYGDYMTPKRMQPHDAFNK